MQFGTLEIHSLSGGRLRFDGGTMFGVVPKALWEKKAPADQRNRVAMNTNCLLVRGVGHTVLIDTGYGTKLGQKQRELFDLQEGDVLVENLARHGVRPQDVDTVILTHLHFDHAGGATRHDQAGNLVPTFPKARHVIQRAEWESATSGAPELGDAYPPENFLPLHEAHLVELIDGDREIVPGIQAIFTGGHTAGHQALLIESGPGDTGVPPSLTRDTNRTGNMPAPATARALYPADICPMRSHLRQMWCMAFDLFPLQTRRIKAELLGRAADEGWLVIWDHDPEVVAGKLVRDPKTEFTVVDPLPIL